MKYINLYSTRYQNNYLKFDLEKNRGCPIFIGNDSFLVVKSSKNYTYIYIILYENYISITTSKI